MNHSISCGDLFARIEERGAQLCSLRYREHEYLWQGDPAYWPDRSPLLFPYVGRFTEGRYTLKGTEHPMTIHGFAAAADFTVTDREDDRIVFELTDNEDTYGIYPYHFALRVGFEAGPAGLKVSYEVENRSDEIMYFGIGGHPGFQVPLEDGLTFDDYFLEFALPCRPWRVGHTPACFLSGHDTEFPLEGGTRLPLRHDLFDEDAIVLKDAADTVTLASEHGSRSVTMRYTGLPYLGIWHAPGTDAPYVCIEPWSSLPSRQDIVEEFTCKSDLIRLQAGGTCRTGWEISLT